MVYGREVRIVWILDWLGQFQEFGLIYKDSDQSSFLYWSVFAIAFCGSDFLLETAISLSETCPTSFHLDDLHHGRQQVVVVAAGGLLRERLDELPALVGVERIA